MKKYEIYHIQDKKKITTVRAKTPQDALKIHFGSAVFQIYPLESKDRANYYVRLIKDDKAYNTRYYYISLSSKGAGVDEYR